MIDIVLIEPPSLCVDDDRLEPPLGLLYLAAAAQEAGFDDIQVMDLSGCIDEADVHDKVDSIPEARFYGVSTYCTTHEYTKHVIARIRLIAPGAYVVVGGPNPSALPWFTLHDTGADAVIVGEGEEAFVHCLKRMNTANPLRDVIQGVRRARIDSYPFPARELIDQSSYSRKLLEQSVISLISSRGCQYRCAHCNSVVMGAGAKCARYRSPDNVVAEILSLRSTYKYFRFNDDHFTGNPNLVELLSQLSDLDIVFRSFARIEDLTEQNCRLLREAGCVHLSVGLESLNPLNLRAVGKIQQLGHERNIKIARDHGLTIRAYFIVGMPYDTDGSVEKYFSHASQIGIDEFTIYPLIPYPGCQIAKNPERYGYTIIDSDFRNYIQIGKNQTTCYALRHRNFGPEDVARWKKTGEALLLTGGAMSSQSSAVAG